MDHICKFWTHLNTEETIQSTEMLISSNTLPSNRPERDFGLETETETWVVSVSSLETTYSKSQYQSQFLRPKWRVSVSVSNFDTINQMSRSQCQQISIGLAHPKYFLWFIYDLQPHDFLISFKYHTFDPIWALNLCHIKCWCASLIPPIQSLSISLNSWDQSESQSRSQLLRPKWKVLVSVSIFETIVKSLSLSLDSWYQQPKVSVSVSKWKVGLAHPCHRACPPPLVLEQLQKGPGWIGLND